MNTPPKRRARFKRGVIPPPLEKPEKTSGLDWFEQYKQRRQDREKRKEERLRKRKPLPDEKTISERFLESTLRCFALAKPEFWEESTRRWFIYPSDFLGKLRLGQHLDSYENVLAICKKVKFPALKCGCIEVKFPSDDSSHRKQTPDISFRLAETAEWSEAQRELQKYLGMSVSEDEINPKAQSLIDFANSVPPGKEVEVPRELYREWSSAEQAVAVRLAQKVNPRLYEEHEDYWNAKLFVGDQPNALLSLPPLDHPLNFPGKLTKSELDRLNRRIEEIVKQEVLRGYSSDEGMVLARTTSRIQARRLFGHLEPDDLAKVCTKLRPVGVSVWWDFPEAGMPWIFGVFPNPGLSWKDVLAQIHAEASQVPSRQKYGLSIEAAALFDWLRSLPQAKFTWNLAPAMSENLLETEAGLKNPWSRENGFLFFQLLAEEISRKTEFVAIARSWNGDYLTLPVRIEFRPKQ